MTNANGRATVMTTGDVAVPTLLHHEGNGATEDSFLSDSTNPANPRNTDQSNATELPVEGPWDECPPEDYRHDERRIACHKGTDGALVATMLVQDIDNLDQPDLGADGVKRDYGNEHVVGVRCFVLDIDFKDFADRPARAYAVQLLKTACAGLELPQPTYIVKTPNGFHAYWMLSHSLDVALGKTAWRQLTALVFTKLKVKPGDLAFLNAKIQEAQPAKRFPGPGQPSRKEPDFTHQLDGGHCCPALTARFVARLNVLIGEASEDIRNLVTPPARPAKTYRATTTDATKAGLIVRVAVRAIELCWGSGGGKLKDSSANGSAADWRAWATSGIAGDEEHGRPGEYLIHEAVIDAHGRRDSHKELCYVKPTGLTIGTLRAKLKEGGHWHQAERELIDTPSPASRPTRAATGATQDASAKAKAHAKANPPSEPAEPDIIEPNSDRDQLWGEDFLRDDHLFRRHYPVRLNMMTRDLLLPDGTNLNISGLHMDARGKGLRVWNGDEPKVVPGGEERYKKTCHPLSKTDFESGIQRFAETRKFYPQCEHIQQIIDDPDVVPVDHNNLASRYLKPPGTGPHTLDDLIIAKAIRGIVARGLEPGATVHLVPVLKGKQNSGKSWLCSVLGGEYFLETVDLGNGEKDELMKYSGYLLGELAEFTNRTKNQNDTKKQATKAADSIRLPYAVKDQRYPRTISFWGTTNEEYFLNDSTGSRRWGVVEVEVKPIDVPRFATERAGIFKHAALHLRDNPDSQLLTQSEVGDMEKRNRRYNVADARQVKLEEYLSGLGELAIRRDGFTVYSFMSSEQGLDMPPGHINPREQGPVRRMIEVYGFAEEQRRPSRQRRMWPTPDWPGCE